jgi:hypothetical protein
VNQQPDRALSQSRDLADVPSPVLLRLERTIKPSPPPEVPRATEHKLLPDCQAEGWDGMWNTESRHYFRREPNQSGPGDYIVAAAAVFDDGKAVLPRIRRR